MSESSPQRASIKYELSSERRAGPSSGAYSARDYQNLLRCRFVLLHRLRQLNALKRKIMSVRRNKREPLTTGKSFSFSARDSAARKRDGGNLLVSNFA
ncbi:hypothetical protein Trydic_g4812 [Trypoxylus dichotomus]